VLKLKLKEFVKEKKLILTTWTLHKNFTTSKLGGIRGSLQKEELHNTNQNLFF
jgi:hypothetical protein